MRRIAAFLAALVVVASLIAVIPARASRERPMEFVGKATCKAEQLRERARQHQQQGRRHRHQARRHRFAGHPRRAGRHRRNARWHRARAWRLRHRARANPCDKWYAFVEGRIALNRSGVAEPRYLTPPLTPDNEPDGRDYKPVPSPDGSQVAFFRLVEQTPFAFTWKSQIWVMDKDGSNPRQLTSGEHTDVNLQWTRDGSNKIFWNRIEPGTEETEPLLGFPFPLGMNVWWTDPDASPGEEVQISLRGAEPLTPYDFAYSGLRDGRIFVRSEGFNQYFLMTPAPYLAGGVSLYEPVIYPTPNTLLHKASISPSETKIAYMKVSDAGPFGIATDPDPKSVIAYADFDAETRTISNEVEITERNLDNRTWYTAWSKDEHRLRYACAGDCPDPSDPGHGQIYEYDLRTGKTKRISGNNALEYRYPATKGIVK